MIENFLKNSLVNNINEHLHTKNYQCLIINMNIFKLTLKYKI